MSVTHPSEGSSNPSSPSSTQNNFNYQAALSNNAPKYGTVVPKRVFVGGINSTTTEDELCELFSQYGLVKQVKIVVDRGGISKGYGFVTFDSEEEAKRLQKDSDNVIFKEKRLNIAPAIKKQGFTGTYDSLPTVTSPVPPAPISNMYYHNGLPYTYHNGTAFFPSNGQPMVPTSPPTVSNQQETAIYPQPTYAPPPSHLANQASAYGAPLMYVQPAPMYMPTQQYQYSAMPYESFYQVAAPNTASYIYASPGPPPIAPSNSVPDGLQYQVYQQPVLPNDMYYAAAAAATAPMYSMPMFVNYDSSFYPYSLESTASNTSTGLDVSSNSNYSEDDPSHYSNPTSVQTPSLAESEAHPTETPVVSLLKLQESHPEERELHSYRRQAPQHKSNNNNNTYHPASNNIHHNDSQALVYYPSNVYSTPGVNNIFLYPNNPHHKPNFRGANFSNSRQKTPNTPRTPQIMSHQQNHNKFPRPMYYNNNTYDHYCNMKHNTGGATTPPADKTPAHDSPKRSVSPPPPPYSPMIQPLFINGESPYSFSPPAPPNQMLQAHPMPMQYPPAPPPPQPRSYQVLNHGAPRRINPRLNDKTSTGPKNYSRNGNSSRSFSILNKHHPAPAIADGSGDAPSLPNVDVDQVSYQLHNYVM